MSGCTRTEASGTEFWFAGDVYLGGPRQVLDAGLDRELNGWGVVNLEAPVGEAVAGGDLRLVHRADALPSLVDAGVAAAQIVNNHAGDAGPAGAAQTRDALGAVGLAAFGGSDRAVVGGATLVAYDLSDGLPADLSDALRDARPQIVAFHTTGEPSPEPVPALREAVDLAVAAGARVIVAQGSHVFGPVERRGDTVIAWGLGNLAFDCPCTRHRDALALSVRLGDRVDARVVPVRAGLDGAPAALHPDAESILDVLGALSPTPIERDDVGASF